MNLVFGTPMDMRGLLRWRASAAARGDPQVRDAMEFRKLATKRWRYYLKGNEAATSLGALRRAIRADPSAEVGFLLMAKASFYEKVLNLPGVTDHFFVQGETMEYCRQQYQRAK